MKIIRFFFFLWQIDPLGGHKFRTWEWKRFFSFTFRKALDHKNESYDTVLEKSIGFNNPNNISYLAGVLGIKEHCTLMKGLK